MPPIDCSKLNNKVQVFVLSMVNNSTLLFT